MSGRDPRQDVSDLYALVKMIGRERLPDEDDWDMICAIVLGNPEYKPARVTMSRPLSSACSGAMDSNVPNK